MGVLRLPRSDLAPGLAREALNRWMGYDHPSLDAVMLVASELVTNAFMHADQARSGGGIRFSLLHHGDCWRIEVKDQGSYSSVPRQKTPAEESEHGRGLQLVAFLSAGRWGTFVHDHRTRARTVWCEVPADPAAVE
ncbi:ATP-binding protein [Sinosporangium siamense]